ncbi:unnamed protein product [Nippostrongylus brasiliensis]|uniref:ACT domain-containing protein n=1 Tax=Nippostrongylus brasiliensis TaxID=27835 RepID=A0A0N4XUA0_NIPBR|nr:hypothetical protein Q1695_014857 [Nippostrongylus brasiliensis]VDL69861.1 unnamed protein product [Nippostrongylus brasiliensis]
MQTNLAGNVYALHTSEALVHILHADAAEEIIMNFSALFDLAGTDICQIVTISDHEETDMTIAAHPETTIPPEAYPGRDAVLGARPGRNHANHEGDTITGAVGLVHQPIHDHNRHI